MHDCEKLREDIWEAIEVGETPDSLLMRLGDCETCRQEFARAQSAMMGFQAMRSADAPDCADAVMAKIDITAYKGRAVWAYAFGLALVLVIVVTLTNWHSSKVAAPSANIAATKPHPSVTPKSPQKLEMAKHCDRRKDIPRASDRTIIDNRERRVHHTAKTPEHSVHHKQAPILVRIIDHSDAQSAAAAVDMPAEHKDPPVTANQPEPGKPQIMIIVMSDSSSPSSYGYKQTNPDTGAVTECSVKRSSKSVEIYMDVRPASQKAPSEGRLDYENTISV